MLSLAPIPGISRLNSLLDIEQSIRDFLQSVYHTPSGGNQKDVPPIYIAQTAGLFPQPPGNRCTNFWRGHAAPLLRVSGHPFSPQFQAALNIGIGTAKQTKVAAGGIVLRVGRAFGWMSASRQHQHSQRNRDHSHLSLPSVAVTLGPPRPGCNDFAEAAA